MNTIIIVIVGGIIFAIFATCAHEALHYHDNTVGDAREVIIDKDRIIETQNLIIKAYKAKEMLSKEMLSKEMEENENK